MKIWKKNKKVKRKISAALTKTSDKRSLFAKKKDLSTVNGEILIISATFVNVWVNDYKCWLIGEEKRRAMRNRLHKDFYKALKWPRKENKIYHIPATLGMCKRRKKTKKTSGKMKGAVQMKWRENTSLEDEINNGEKREGKGNWCHYEH